MRNKIFLLFILCLAELRSQPVIQVDIPEAYELSNIILALTKYGREDPTQVQKGTAYYKEVLAYFGPYTNHPLIRKVNYSDQTWDKYLSFRTDAFAFSFDKNNHLKRNSRFYSMRNFTLFGMNEFDQNVRLVEDFARQSKFRDFYKMKKPFYDSIQKLYYESLMAPQAIDFLSQAFSIKPESRYAIIISPLVGGMHCQRKVNDVPTSFVSIPVELYSVKSISEIKREDLAANLHVYFTEIDHDYVNPTTTKYKKAYASKFDPNKWDRRSGYARYKYATFNEYMTWAVYDLFLAKHFPEISDSLSTQWHYVNARRGFFASSAFAHKLQELYTAKSEAENMAGLYPKMLDWCSEFQKTSSLPEIVSPTEGVKVKSLSTATIEIVFTEPMMEKETFSAVLITSQNEEDTETYVTVKKNENKITWSDQGKKLTFQINVPAAEGKITLRTTGWGCKIPLESKKGIMLKVPGKIFIRVS